MAWEYKIVQPEMKGLSVGFSGRKAAAQSEEFLNKFGREGWECYHVKTDTFPSIFYLKRPR